EFEDDDDPPVTRDNSVAAPQDAAASDSEIERRFTATVIPLDVNLWSQSQNETEHLYQSSNTDKFRRRRRCQVAGTESLLGGALKHIKAVIGSTSYLSLWVRVNGVLINLLRLCC
ncbi:hypothetical protein JG687_00018000, partial [Phytophthora cactorum]